MKKKIFIFLTFLFLALPLNSAIAVDFQFYTNLYFGMRNNAEVIQLQGFLIENKYLNISVPTGNFYSLTLQAVQAYQFRNGISPTGYFGPLTRAKVNEELRLMTVATIPVEESKVAESQESKPALVSPPPPVPEEQSGYRLNQKPAYDSRLIARGIQDIINQERQKAGLVELTWYDALSDVARLHSADQVADNAELTDPDKLCHYPLIRHEGIRGGYSLVDRLNAGGISSYRIAGENILTFSTGKNFTYEYRAGEAPAECQEVAPYPTSEGTMEERLALYNEVLAASLQAAKSSSTANWVNKEWLSVEDIGRKAVELWLNSPGHRENILRAEFNYGGIGVVEVNDYLIITHDFLGKN